MSAIAAIAVHPGVHYNFLCFMGEPFQPDIKLCGQLLRLKDPSNSRDNMPSLQTSIRKHQMEDVEVSRPARVQRARLTIYVNRNMKRN